MVHALTHSTSPEVAERVLELIRSASEDEDLMVTMAESELLPTLMDRIIGRWSTGGNEEYKALRNNACDLIVLILSEDKSMRAVYSWEDGKVVRALGEWLDRSDNQQLQLTAALALGNVACDEDHGKELMGNLDVGPKLLALMDIEVESGEVKLKLEQAVLGALKNICVSPYTRATLVRQGLVGKLCEMLPKLSIVSQQMVIFKLIGTLRLAVDGSGESARAVAEDRERLDLLVGWGNAETQHVRYEISRLMAALVKNGTSQTVLRNMVESGGLALITAMLVQSLGQPRMLNEALFACNILAAAMTDRALMCAHMQTDLIITGVKAILRKPDMDSQLKYNALMLIKTLLLGGFAKQLRDLNFVDEAITRESLGDDLYDHAVSVNIREQVAEVDEVSQQQDEAECADETE